MLSIAMIRINTCGINIELIKSYSVEDETSGSTGYRTHNENRNHVMWYEIMQVIQIVTNMHNLKFKFKILNGFIVCGIIKIHSSSNNKHR